jgi:hypothetical protein
MVHVTVYGQCGWKMAGPCGPRVTERRKRRPRSEGPGAAVRDGVTARQLPRPSGRWGTVPLDC